jgi:cell wall-associated NlpC family hydrolase
VPFGGLRAGDLVFFHSPISHVGIYLGGGMMLHAPHTGDVVKVAPLFEPPSAAVRL